MPDELDLRLTEALETAPEVRIPADFAARVISRVPHTSQSHHDEWVSTTPRIALWTIRAAFALLILAMFLAAPSALTHATASLTLEFLFAAEFVMLAVWTSLRPQTS